MRILQIATLITPDGAYGGPVRVAVNQTRALLEAGHDVVLAAGARGFGNTLPTTFDGVPVKLFPANSVPKLGFAGTYSRNLFGWLRNELKTSDLMHVHMGRDFVTLPAAAVSARTHKPYVVQTHGMIVPSAHILASPVDTFWTKPVLKRAARVLFLTDKEREGLERLVPSALRLQHLPNGVPDLSGSNSPSEAVEVLFLARLHSRKRPLIFIEMAKKLHSHFPEARFTLVGPDEGEGSAVRSAIAASGMRGALHWEGSVEPQQSAARIGRSSIYVLPSIDEPFPMSVLEAMSLGKPVVITDSCGLAGAVSAASAGAVVGEDIESLTSAVATLLESPQHRNEAAENARKLVRDKFAMPEIVRQLTDLYQDVSQRHVS